MMPNLLNVYKRIQITDGCWLWTAPCDKAGYGAITWGWKERKRTRKAHQIVYEMFHGPIPKGLVLDHTCHSSDKSCMAGNNCLHRRCVNPLHLEAVTHKENCARSHHRLRTHCKRGHSYAEGNTRMVRAKDGHTFRECIECARAKTRDIGRRQRAAYRAANPISPVTHCKWGHPFDEENTYKRPTGGRACKTCMRVRNRQRKQRIRSEALTRIVA